MGNWLAVENHTENAVELTLYLAGSKSDSKVETISSHNKRKIYFSPSFTQSKTVIVGINNKAYRAVRFNRSINIIQSDDGSIRIEILPKRFQLQINTESIIEKQQQEWNWNLLPDESARNGQNKLMNETIRMMNDMCNLLGNVVTNVVRDIPTNKAMSGLIGKLLSDCITNGMKTAQIQQKATGSESKRLQKIQQKLIGISRAVQIDYPYLREEMNIERKEAFEFLHEQLMKITSSDLLVSLECCGQGDGNETQGEAEAAVLVYLFAVQVAVGIFREIRLLNQSEKPSKLERKYLSIFGDNLEEMWANVIERLPSDCEMKTKGFVVKNLELRYRNQHIYRLQSLFRGRVVARMKDIREAFIANRRYQMELLYGQPLHIVKTWKALATEHN